MYRAVLNEAPVGPGCGNGTCTVSYSGLLYRSAYRVDTPRDVPSAAARKGATATLPSWRSRVLPVCTGVP